MKRFLTISAFSLAVLVVVLGATAWWLLTDMDWIRAQAQKAVTDLTGRELSIGRIEIDWSLRPEVSIATLSLANTPGADPQAMLHVGHAKVQIDLTSLMSPPIHFPKLVLNDVELLLAEDDDKGFNWHVFPTSDAPDTSEPITAVPVFIESLKIGNTRVTYRTPRYERPLVSHLDNGVLTTSPEGKVAFDLHGELAHQRLKAEGYVTPILSLFNSGPLRHRILLTLGGITLESDGTVEDLYSLRGAEMTGRFSGPDLSWITDILALPAMTSGPFEAALDLQKNDAGVGVDLHGNLGLLEARVKGQMENLHLSRADLTFDVRGPDMGGLLGVFGIADLPHEAFSLSGRLERADGKTVFENIVADIGQTHMAVDGTLGAWPDFIGTRLAVQARGPDLSAYGPVLGITPVPAQAFSIQTTLNHTQEGLELGRTEVHLGTSTAIAEGWLGIPPRMIGTDLVLDLSGKDLLSIGWGFSAAKLPKKPFTVKGRLQSDARVLVLNNIAATLGDTKLDVDGRFSLAADFIGSDLTVSGLTPDLQKLGQDFGLKGLPSGNLTLKGRLQRDAKGIVLDKVIATLGETKLDVDGRFSPGTDFIGSDLTVSAQTPDVQKLGQVFGLQRLPPGSLTLKGRLRRTAAGLEYSGVTAQLGDFRLKADGLAADLDTLADIRAQCEISGPSLATVGNLAGMTDLPAVPFDIKGKVHRRAGTTKLEKIRGSVGDASFEVHGTLGDPPELKDTELTIRAQGPDIWQLIPREGSDSDPTPFSISGGVAPDGSGIALKELEIGLDTIVARLNGRIGDIRSLQDMDLSVGLNAPSLAVLGTLVERDLPDEPFRLDADFSGSPNDFEMQSFTVTLGPSDLRGTAAVQLDDPPSIRGNFESALIDLRWLGEPPALQDAAVADEAGMTAVRQQFVFPDTPIPTDMLEKARLDIQLRADKVSIAKGGFSDLRIGVKLSNGALMVDPLELEGVQGGRIGATVAVNLRQDSVLLNSVLDADAVKLGLMAAAGQDPATYPSMDMDITIDGEGHTWHELAASLDGRFKIIQAKGYVSNSSMTLILGDLLLEVIEALNPFAKKEPLTRLDCGVYIADITGGMVDLHTFVTQTDKLTILSQGTIDLNTEVIDITFGTKPRKGIGISASLITNPFFKLGGTLASPKLNLDPVNATVLAGTAVATLGLSLLAKGLFDRHFSDRNPCGSALKNDEKRLKKRVKREAAGKN